MTSIWCPGSMATESCRAAAGIQARAGAIVQTRALQRGRLGSRAVASQELRAVAGIRSRPRAGRGKRRMARVAAVPVLASPAIAPDGSIVRGLHVHLLIFADRAEHPLRKVGDGEPALPSGIVAQTQAAHLHRIAGPSASPARTPSVPGRWRGCCARTRCSPGRGAPGTHPFRGSAAALASTRRRSRRRAGRSLPIADRSPDRCARESAGSSGCCRTRCSPARSRSPWCRSRGFAMTFDPGRGRGAAGLQVDRIFAAVGE